METELVYASHVDEYDFIVIAGTTHQIMSIADNGDVLIFSLVDDDYEYSDREFAPFDAVEVVLTFEEPFEFEDVEIEDDEDD